jgi:hypothetical protein
MSTLEPSPGTFVPNVSPGTVSGGQAVTLRPPANLAQLQAWQPKITGFPATSWGVGVKVTLGDASDAHWTGSAWAVGPG